MNYLKQLAWSLVKGDLKKWIKERGFNIPAATEVSIASEAAEKLAKALKVNDPFVVNMIQSTLRSVITRVETEVQNAAIAGVDSIRL